jgi:activator of HSP90 ATPase
MPIFLPQVIPVFNGDMTELCSTSSAKARILVKQKKAKVICTHPFVIRLNYVKETTKRDKEIISHKKS